MPSIFALAGSLLRMPAKTSVTACALVVVALLAGACGGDSSGEAIGEAGDPSEVDRVIEIETTDELRFDPSEIEVAAGETIEFQITNVASSPHEFVLGPAQEHTGMQHTETNATGEIPPGETASVIWSFPEAGETGFMCHIANHHKSGMTGTVTVSE